jgi:hypothetical protein
MRKPQDYFHRVWSTAFRASDLVAAGDDEQDSGEQEQSTLNRPGVSGDFLV